MHIKEVVIDGFKSYAHRTVVEGFDPHFNAITGLNGSGKSNILDSICFVLGITNLSQVRAGNLSELVYKQGQAGVNKAVVTIIFNNENPEFSPLGYEDSKEVTVTRQVLLGGKSKYVINGKNAPVSQVQNLFHSVQLNVNNPHFLIMQGRITKVLNMKPHEILGMVEEAAGTRMYETKRVTALKTIEKKQAKLDELNNVLSEEITPTLDRLRGEKQSYLKWSKNSADIERMERFVVAFQYHKATTALENDTEGSASMEEQVVTLQATKDETKTELEEKEAEIADRTSKLKGDFQESLDEAKALEDKRSKTLVKATSAWNSAKDTVSKAEGDLKVARSLLQETKDAVKAKENEISDESSDIEKVREEAEEAEERLAKLTKTYQNMSAGINTEQGEETGTLPEQISKAISDAKTAESKAKQAKMRMSHLSKELKSVEKELSKTQKSTEKLSAQKEKAQNKVDNIRQDLEGLDFSAKEYDELELANSQLSGVVNELSASAETLGAQMEAKLAFQYADPVRGFDRSRVKGALARLIKITEAKNATALEVVAGGKLYQIVVEDATTAKALLDRGKLKKRVTMIPLDKIQARHTTNAAIKGAESIAKANNTTATNAIELIDFDEEIRDAVQYAFGSAIVVEGEKAANEICDTTRTRTVTLEGDVYNPSGTISGGSKNNLGTTLSSLMELQTLRANLQDQSKRLNDVRKKLDALKQKSATYEKMSYDLSLAEAELESVRKSLSQTSGGMLLEKRDRITAEIEKAERDVQEMEKEHKSKLELHKRLQSQEAELTQQRELRFAEIEKSLKEVKAEVDLKSQRAEEVETQAQTLSLEVESLKEEVGVAEEAVKVAEKAVADASKKEGDLQMQVGDARASYEEAKGALDEIKDRMTSFSSKLVSLNRERADLMKKASDIELEIKRLSISIARVQKERAAAERAVSTMQNKYPWIESEKSAFGIAGGDYDFDAHDPDNASQELKRLKDETEELSRKVNKKVMGMIEKAEGEYVELLRKRQVVENDKAKIQKVIEELDVKKKTEIESTWVKVNKDFGAIFSTLLPGASAKLEPPEGMAAWEGLEVKVAFGEVWKESLSELSGGQRSLLALSLILSLLLFKPAPMYILDEVDAALDLSHTQNIGNMLKTHFSQSQFIVVSLKEGMFNNANVIFKTKFVDGVSTVSRTIGVGSSRSTRALTESTQDIGHDTGPTKKKRTSRRDGPDPSEKENEFE